MSFDKFIQDGQDPKVVEKIYSKISDMLTHGELLNYIAVQKKPAVNLLPDSITISNKRIFLCEFTKLGLATNFEIFSWKDIKDIAFKEEIFGSKVTVIPFTGENLSIDYIPKVQARKLYQLIKDALENGKTIIEEDQSARAPLREEPKPVTTPMEYENHHSPISEEPKAATINDMYRQWADQKKESTNEEQQPEVESEKNKEPETALFVEDTAEEEYGHIGEPDSDDFSYEPEELPVTKAEEEILPEVEEESPDEVEPSFEQDEPTYQPLVYSAPSEPQPVPVEEEEDEMTRKLKKLKSLYDKQLITQAEYESKKSEILSQL